MRYSKWIGLPVCLILIVSTFLPWTFHADINKTFTGFFSEQNIYGKPGKFFILLAVLSILLLLTDKLWAKRLHIFLCGMGVAYAIKTYILYTSCYDAYCPDKKYGIYIMLAASVILLIVSIFPDVKLKKQDEQV